MKFRVCPSYNMKDIHKNHTQNVVDKLVPSFFPEKIEIEHICGLRIYVKPYRVFFICLLYVQ